MGPMTATPRMKTVSPVFDKLYSEAELAAMTRRQRNTYENSLRLYRDTLSDIATERNARRRAMAEGRAEGIAQGMAQGMAQGQAKGEWQERIRNAKAMKATGLSCMLIAQIAGLPIDEITQI